ncbi:MAG: OmpA family protein [Betaproteobacteria bacterium]|nr:OmpA family protein [Betaproteobacteria bacterium]
MNIPRFSRYVLAALSLFLAVACQTPPPPPPGLTPEQISKLKSSGFSETDEGWALNLDARLLFDTSSAALNQREQDSLKKIANTLISIGIADIIIEGHTDSTGSEQYNRELSRKRAEMVADYLASDGMSREHMQIEAKGSSSPIASNTTREGRTENRRTVIIIPMK